MGSCRYHFPVRILCSIWVCVVFQPFGVGVGQRLTQSGAHGAWSLGSIKQKSTHWRCAQGRIYYTFKDVKALPATDLSHRGASAAVATNWVFGFVCTQFTSVGIRNLGYKFYISTYPQSDEKKIRKADVRSVRHFQPRLHSCGIFPIPRDRESDSGGSR